jgi:hypothetical protein
LGHIVNKFVSRGAATEEPAREVSIPMTIATIASRSTSLRSRRYIRSPQRQLWGKSRQNNIEPAKRATDSFEFLVSSFEFALIARNRTVARLSIAKQEPLR